MEDQIYARHGDLVIRKEAVPPGLALAKPTAPLILAGHETAPHTIARFGDVEYAEADGVQRLRVAKHVTLTHGGRHTEISLEPGDYAIEPLAEMRGDLVQAVDD
jgi:hypothetical protein